MLRIACVGAGGHGKVVADAAVSLARDEIVGFLDDDPSLAGRSVVGLPVLGPISAWRDFGIEAIVPAIGANRARREIILRETSQGATAMTIIHPSAIISGWAELCAGVTVMAGAVVNAGAVVGENAIVNTGAIVEHDCLIGPHVHIAPGCCLAGEVSVGEGTFLGIGSRVLPSVRVGDWCVIGAGAVVTKDVEDNITVVGVPARRIR
jgi:sugar O-acyltransferase (sialic acid O-acetyltransferase NeuD family)